MVIRENNLVVGILDDSTMTLVNSESERLTSLIDGWRKDGMEVRVGPLEELPEGQSSADGIAVLPLSKEWDFIVISKLESEGFDVQTA